MCAPSENYEKRLVAMFDSFIKTDARHFCRNFSLPENRLKVLFLDFGYALTDEEIAKRMEVTVCTVYHYKRLAFRAIRRFYERGSSES